MTEWKDILGVGLVGIFIGYGLGYAVAWRNFVLMIRLMQIEYESYLEILGWKVWDE